MSKSLSEWMNIIQTFHCSTIELGLSRVISVAKRLNLITFKPTVVKVAGTNGKGSTVAALEALALSDGLRVATYTSPHFKCITERLQINGQKQSAAAWCNAFEQINRSRLKEPLTFFEFTTLAVLFMIKSVESELDLIVLEIGMGGRLDAVNVVQTPYSIITKIALDHQAYLGNTRAQIAKEKAGVSDKGGVVVCADLDPPDEMKHTLICNQSTAYYLEKDFFISSKNDCYSFSYRHISIENLEFSLHPNNIAAALMMWHQLPIAKPFSQQQRLALASLTLPGRFDINTELGIICDVAHNPDSVNDLLGKLAKFKHSGNRMIAVCAMLADKDFPKVIHQSNGFFDEWFLPCIEHDRAMSWRQIKQHVPWYNRSSMCVAQALDIAQSMREQKDWLVVFGSFFIVSEAMSHISVSL